VGHFFSVLVGIRSGMLTSPSAYVSPGSHADPLSWEDNGVILQGPLLAAACRTPPGIPSGSVQHSQCCRCHQGCGAREPTHPGRRRTSRRVPMPQSEARKMSGQRVVMTASPGWPRWAVNRTVIAPRSEHRCSPGYIAERWLTRGEPRRSYPQ